MYATKHIYALAHISSDERRPAMRFLLTNNERRRAMPMHRLGAGKCAHLMRTVMRCSVCLAVYA